MGTRSATLFIDGNQTVCQLYRQLDGYPEGHGVDLARACNVRLCNGFSSDQPIDQWANCISCLAAQVVANFKTGIGIERDLSFNATKPISAYIEEATKIGRINA